MTASAHSETVVKIRDTADLAAVVPYLLGFVPSDSLVVLALSGPRERVRFSLRHDLLHPRHDGDVARMCAARMAHERATSAVVLVYARPPSRPGSLPRRRLVESIQRALPMPMREALLVAEDRIWSYVCPDDRCCPPEGRPMVSDSDAATTIAAAHVLAGDTVLPSRDALLATTRPIGGIAAESMRQALVRAAAHAAAPPDLAESLRAWDCAGAELSDNPASLTHDRAAALIIASHDLMVRDAVIARIARRDDVTARLVADLAPLAQPPLDAPLATMFAMAAYFRGDGVVAVAAAERALHTDPDYSLAQLLVQAIEGQLDPRHMRKIWSRHRR